MIVGTTEIYRNQLFDALRQGEQVRTDFVILDEAHYLADEDRGHVWEEAIILSPPRIRLLLLSATIGNAEEFARWIEEVRGVSRPRHQSRRLASGRASRRVSRAGFAAFSAYLTSRENLIASSNDSRRKKIVSSAEDVKLKTWILKKSQN